MTVRLAGLTVLLGLLGAWLPWNGANPVIPSHNLFRFPTDQAVLGCTRVNIYWGDKGLMPLEGRLSPFDSTLVIIGRDRAKVCYGRPSMRDREIFGGLVPFDTLWRTGANEPTTIHLPFAASIAGLAVQPGSYTL
jgi:Protein of unknown function (DUF2911)